jgi:hypothetical protein
MDLSEREGLPGIRDYAAAASPVSPTLRAPLGLQRPLDCPARKRRKLPGASPSRKALVGTSPYDTFFRKLRGHTHMAERETV